MHSPNDALLRHKPGDSWSCAAESGARPSKKESRPEDGGGVANEVSGWSGCNEVTGMENSVDYGVWSVEMTSLA